MSGHGSVVRHNEVFIMNNPESSSKNYRLINVVCVVNSSPRLVLPTVLVQVGIAEYHSLGGLEATEI